MARLTRAEGAPSERRAKGFQEKRSKIVQGIGLAADCVRGTVCRREASAKEAKFGARFACGARSQTVSGAHAVPDLSIGQQCASLLCSSLLRAHSIGHSIGLHSFKPATVSPATVSPARQAAKMIYNKRPIFAPHLCLSFSALSTSELPKRPDDKRPELPPRTSCTSGSLLWQSSSRKGVLFALAAKSKEGTKGELQQPKGRITVAQARLAELEIESGTQLAARLHAS